MGVDTKNAASVHRHEPSMPKPLRALALLLFGLPVVCGMDWPQYSSNSSRVQIAWKPCQEDPSFMCGYLDVPTDYNNPLAGMSRLALTKYPRHMPRLRASWNHHHKRVPGRDASFASGARIQDMTGNRHDIISFDQRGLGHSHPKVNCFGSALKYEQFKTNTVFETTFSVPNAPFSEAGRAVLVEQQKQALALEETQGAVCAEAVGAEALGYMSTTTTVYDMEEISRVLVGEDQLINFWGGSYGTIVGAYLANMLPHKAGKIFIDGVAPADMWANEHYDSQALLRLLLTDSENTYQFYLTDCFNAGPAHCALASVQDSSAKDIEARIDAFVDRLQAQPLRVTNYTRPGYLTSGGVRSSLFNALQVPETWAAYARMLARAIDDADAAPLLAMVARKYSAPAPAPDAEGYVATGQGELQRLAISCGDARPYAPGEAWPTAGEIVDNILVTLKESPRFGATVHLMEQHGGCHFWPGTGVGPTRFTGPFNKTLATPTLILANTHDPITPYKSAKLVLDTMGDSARLVVQGTAGHSYLAPMTDCAKRVVQRYFAEGAIPQARETRCGREIDNFFVDREKIAVNPKLVHSRLGF
ncbi:TAP-like protein-domain-containing protein [Mycena belliarum]|uniref:TAP-like protein-domain-containing protein n=1 Tax=Mycena belliarum TaxID=1033014 RepID=A0AAD6XK65_9AGAR|nr:TAP-like protein-domain-containing protein [Mycena belliae]